MAKIRDVIKERFQQQQSLQQLLKDICDIPKEVDRMVSGLCIDNRKIVRGDVFIALPGSQVHGKTYIDASIVDGAVAVLVDDKKFAITWSLQRQIPIIKIPNLKHCYGKIASRFFAEPSKKMTVIGVTGTNGKSSIAYYLTACLQHLGKKAAMIGTLGYGKINSLQTQLNTTPDALTVHRLMSEMYQDGCEYVVMEVSSHALDQHRVEGVDFNVAIFTNLSRDHLDYHQSMEAYALAKQKLFIDWPLDFAVINADDSQGCELLKKLWGKKKIYAYSANGEKSFEFVDQVGLMAHVPTVSAHDVQLTNSGVDARLQTPWGGVMLQSPLLGHFNLSNVLAVVTTLSVLDFHIDEVVEEIKRLPQVPGRMQSFHAEDKPLVIVDYAHTPDALEKVLEVAKKTCKGKLTVVFGCGGARDQGKRSAMGEVAECLADKIILTDDNARTEEPEKIIDDIMTGIKKPKKVIIEHDRATAIQLAITTAKAKDTVLIAGKGHEDYQEVNGERSHFSDIEQVEQQLELS